MLHIIWLHQNNGHFSNSCVTRQQEPATITPYMWETADYCRSVTRGTEG